jgi:hypothetical protein
MSDNTIVKHIVSNSVGKANPYLEKLLLKIFENDYHQHIISRDKKLRNVELELKEQIDYLKNSCLEGDDIAAQQQLVINAIMKEKIKDREIANSERRLKNLYAFLTLVLPIITNLIQYLINKFFE